ncbi:MAG: hypothetical protein AAF193_10070, partial [Bacteroidota bacterium]
MKVIGTRGSKLALWQAHHVQDVLKSAGAVGCGLWAVGCGLWA